MNFAIDSNTIISVIKLAAIIFALVHLGVGFALFRQVMTLNKKVRTQSGGCLSLFSIAHILVLALTIFLIVFL